MALTDEQRGPRAAWLRRHRRARYGSGDGGLAKLAAALRQQGLDRSATTIKGWESSDDRSPIPPEVLPALEDLFGEPAPRPMQAASTPELVAALRDQTAAISSLVEILGQRQPRVSEASAAYVADPAVAKRRRAYWIQQAFAQSKLTRAQLRVAVELPAGRERTLARWLAGELPAGAQLQRFARALMLPLTVLEEPPPTDDERLVQWRQEAIAELPVAEEAAPARQRRAS